MSWVAGLAFLFLVKKFVDFLRYASARDVNGVVTQLVVWVAGVGAVLIAAQTGWADQISFGSSSLGGLGTWSQVFLGLTLGSASSVLVDTLKSVDSTDSGIIPKLLRKG